MTALHFIFLHIGLGGGSIDSEALKQLERFERSWAQLQTLEYILEKTERLRDGRVTEEAALVKFSKPSQFYIAALKPKKGQEILYDPRKRDGELLVHPGHFPDFTLSLDIRGSLATSGQHHIVSHSGYDYIIKQIRQVIHGLKTGFLEGQSSWEQSVKTNKVLIALQPLAPKLINALADETLFAFAKRVNMDPYRIFMDNPSIDALSDELDEDEIYSVPWYYGRVMELTFDRESHLLIRQQVWLSNGVLYEDYRFKGLQVNPVFDSMTFHSENPDYDF